MPATRAVILTVLVSVLAGCGTTQARLSGPNYRTEIDPADARYRAIKGTATEAYWDEITKAVGKVWGNVTSKGVVPHDWKPLQIEMLITTEGQLGEIRFAKASHPSPEAKQLVIAVLTEAQKGFHPFPQVLKEISPEGALFPVDLRLSN